MVVGLIWNGRGLNKPEKINAMGKLIRETHADLVGFSESKKESFSNAQIKSIDPNNDFTWNWMPAIGTAGGILVGIKQDDFKIISVDILQFSVACLIKDKKDGRVWRFITVYGAAYDNLKLEVINELHNTMEAWLGPTIIGGDFNLVRSSEEKNTGSVNLHWVTLFNDWVNKYALIELKNYTRKFTWANNQDNLVMANIDKIFISTCWEHFFPAVQIKALPRVGSDHTP
ncbi:hypothetical protein VPH35_116143 [Triticum aestivum]